jgi:uncharacterized membrane protein
MTRTGPPGTLRRMAYDVLLFLHILAAMAWIGSGFLAQVLAVMAQRRRHDATFATLFQYVADLGLKLFMPASLAVVVLGVALVADGPWSFDQLWIVLGLVGFAATFLTGLLVFKPQGDRLAEMIERDGGTMGPEAQTLAMRLLTLGRIDYVVLLAVVFDMAVKPTGDDVGALIAMAAAIVAGVVVVLGQARRIGAPAPAAAPL